MECSNDKKENRVSLMSRKDGKQRVPAKTNKIDNKRGVSEDDISKTFPNFMALTEEEKVTFFEALTEARKSVEKSGQPARERFGTVHDEYLKYFDDADGDGMREEIRTKIEEENLEKVDAAPNCQSSSDNDTSLSFTSVKSFNKNQDFMASPDVTLFLGESTERSILASESTSSVFKESSKIALGSKDQIMLSTLSDRVSWNESGNFPEEDKTSVGSDSRKERRGEEYSLDETLEEDKLESAVNENFKFSCRQLDYLMMPQNEGSKLLYKENIQTDEIEDILTGMNMPRFDALTSEERDIFFSILREAHDNIVKKNPDKKTEIIPLDTILKSYQNQNDFTTVYSTSIDESTRKEKVSDFPKEGGRNIKVKVTITSRDNERLEETARYYGNSPGEISPVNETQNSQVNEKSDAVSETSSLSRAFAGNIKEESPKVEFTKEEEPPKKKTEFVKKDALQKSEESLNVKKSRNIRESSSESGKEEEESLQVKKLPESKKDKKKRSKESMVSEVSKEQEALQDVELSDSDDLPQDKNYQDYEKLLSKASAKEEKGKELPENEEAIKFIEGKELLNRESAKEEEPPPQDGGVPEIEELRKRTDESSDSVVDKLGKSSSKKKKHEKKLIGKEKGKKGKHKKNKKSEVELHKKGEKKGTTDETETASGVIPVRSKKSMRVNSLPDLKEIELSKKEAKADGTPDGTRRRGKKIKKEDMDWGDNIREAMKLEDFVLATEEKKEFIKENDPSKKLSSKLDIGGFPESKSKKGKEEIFQAKQSKKVLLGTKSRQTVLIPDLESDNKIIKEKSFHTEQKPEQSTEDHQQKSGKERNYEKRKIENQQKGKMTKSQEKRKLLNNELQGDENLLEVKSEKGSEIDLKKKRVENEKDLQEVKTLEEVKSDVVQKLTEFDDLVEVSSVEVPKNISQHKPTLVEDNFMEVKLEKEKEKVPEYKTGKVVLVDDDVIDNIRKLIQDLEKKAKRESNSLENEYLQLLLGYIEYLSKVLQSLITQGKGKVQQIVTAAEVHLKFNDQEDLTGVPNQNNQVEQGIQKNQGEQGIQKNQGEQGTQKNQAEEKNIKADTEIGPRGSSSSSSIAQYLQKAVKTKKEPKEPKDSKEPKEPKESKESKTKPEEKYFERDSSTVLSDDSESESSVSSDENKEYQAPMAMKKKALPTTKIRLLQDLLKERAKFVEGSLEEYKIVHLPKEEYIPEEKGNHFMEFKDEEEEPADRGKAIRFFRALVRFCRCWKKESGEGNLILENLKGEAVPVDVSEGKTKDATSVTLNESTMKVLKAAERKKLISKYYKSRK